MTRTAHRLFQKLDFVFFPPSLLVCFPGVFFPDFPFPALLSAPFESSDDPEDDPPSLSPLDSADPDAALDASESEAEGLFFANLTEPLFLFFLVLGAFTIVLLLFSENVSDLVADESESETVADAPPAPPTAFVFADDFFDGASSVGFSFEDSELPELPDSSEDDEPLGLESLVPDDASLSSLPLSPLLLSVPRLPPPSSSLESEPPDSDDECEEDWVGFVSVLVGRVSSEDDAKSFAWDVVPSDESSCRQETCDVHRNVSGF